VSARDAGRPRGSPPGAGHKVPDGNRDATIVADPRDRRTDLLVSRRPELAADDLAAALGSRVLAWRWLRAALNALDGGR
jgi:hypothetical protein